MTVSGWHDDVYMMRTGDEGTGAGLRDKAGDYRLRSKVDISCGTPVILLRVTSNRRFSTHFTHGNSAVDLVYRRIRQRCTSGLKAAGASSIYATAGWV